ncbi:hypothetical protein BZA05DRAFT_382648 [Tricharina praecox]|uniref:uncharacterized protein n=1 Tax=Tricharina praecox TaxID=43433 RepID=UPI00221E98FB|nr:uncharacterized protein BZA05DRAFT_382648 [Tricharina praecox]KAI5858864.1 hypothetical protein BZA05DRAFT_382648 [Tricharina praecox]
MGVHGLWKILEPAHRPVKLETLARKRLAVDASIWIYQFLKAVRDADGNALHNSHIVGFFRRICKLLFHGIRPVFVFDGGAPALKRQTIAGRKQRREGKREDAAQTARKLLALQIKKRAEEQAQISKGPITGDEGDWETLPEKMVYVDEIEQTDEQRKAMEEQRRKTRFKKTDQYQLPEMEYDFSQFGASNDVRMLSADELQEYARQFEGMEDTNLADYSDIDFSSPFFAALPDADRYRIINQARLRSRLRMGYSMEQLDAMFPNRMAFSKFQIERVVRRNELSQRLMNLQGRDADLMIGRVAGERDKEYVMVRNEKDTGWAMTFVGNKGELEGAQSKPIDVEKLGEEDLKVEDSDEDVEFEDVPVEGLNRLPKGPRRLPPELARLRGGEAIRMRQALYDSRMEQTGSKRKSSAKDTGAANDALFLGSDIDDVLFEIEDEELEADEDLRNAIAMSLRDRGFQVENDDEDLQRAIASSLGNTDGGDGKGKGKAVETTESSFQDDQGEEGTNDIAYQQVVAESLKPQPRNRSTATDTDNNSGTPSSSMSARKLPGKLDLSNSRSFLFGKNKKPLSLNPKLKSAVASKAEEEEEPVRLPPWFSGGGIRDILAEVEKAKQTTKEQFAELEAPQPREGSPISLSSDDDSDVEFLDVAPSASQRKAKPEPINTDELAERLRAIPPDSHKAESAPQSEPVQPALPVAGDSDEEIEWSDSEDEQTVPAPQTAATAAVADTEGKSLLLESKGKFPPTTASQLDDVGMGPPPNIRLPSPPPDEIEEPDDFEISFDREPTPPQELALEDADENELILQMEREQAEHARFAAEITHGGNRAQNALDYEQELKSLRTQQKKDRRDADEVTQVMIQECQQLLTLFGLPYITAPMEAEAQCAELVKLGLVDGIVTDDSDVFLFGGTRVYRYMFNDKQVVQCYLTSDLEKEFSLDQNRLIAAALLLGSDYTEGIPNVGPVTAIELLAEFADEGLAGFKEWWTKVQQGADTPEESSSRFRRKFKRANTAKIFLPPSFPNARVVNAYLHPEVDSDPSTFEWGVPDLEGLRTFLINTLGWSKERTDQILVPVIKDMNQKTVEGGQVNITHFFGGPTGTGAFAPRVRPAGKSSRIEKAMELLKRKGDGEDIAEEEPPKKKPMSMRERFAQDFAEGDDAAGETKEKAQEVEKPKKGRKAAPKRKPAKRGKKTKAK